MGRAPCCDKANVKKGPWSPEEDAKLKSYMEQHGTGGNWIALPQKIGLKRCGKSCRLRWLNYLRPNIKHGGFSEEEDNIICSLYISIGSRWSIIAAQLPGRTDNDIKNYWNTKLKKKLLGTKQRKDQSQNRWGARALKQEDKRVENGDLLMASDGAGSIGASPSAYWPDPNVPMYPITQAEYRVNNEHSSIRKLLKKLGGRFPNDASYAAPAQQVYDAMANIMTTSSMVQANSLIAEGLPGSGGFNPTELDDIFGSNSVKLEGLDCFYGTGNMVNDGHGASTSPDTANWSEVSPLMNYQSAINSYQSLQTCLFEEPVHHGMQ